MNGSPTTSRKVIFKIITAVTRKGRPFDEALELELNSNKLDSRDRAFVRMLATTVLRRLGQIDDILSRYIERSLPKNICGVEDILRIGTAQIVFLKTPAHASVDTSVKLAASFGFNKYKGLINAVLRKVAKDGETILKTQDEAKLNTPKWLWQNWQKFYGKDLCYQIAEANLLEPNLDITVKSNPKDWAEKLGGEVLPTKSIRLKNNRMITEMEGFNAGEWWVQDVSATIPVKILGNVKGLRVADLCSAPGGKTAQLINDGAIVTAVDRSENRMKRQKDNLRRLNLSCETIVADVQKWFEKNIKNNEKAELFDAVLLDAPCSATGTIRRNPDIALLKTAKDIAKINDLQIKLLKIAFQIVKKGGTIVYSVCSLEKEEGENCVKEALKENHKIELNPIKQGEFEEIDKTFGKTVFTKEGYLRTLPFYANGVDGFFVARFIRKV